MNDRLEDSNQDQADTPSPLTIHLWASSIAEGGPEPPLTTKAKKLSESSIPDVTHGGVIGFIALKN